jgi:hypothetical protein
LFFTGTWNVTGSFRVKHPPCGRNHEEESRKGVVQYPGFSLHAGIGIEAEARTKLERLAYVSRPPPSPCRNTSR